MTEPLELNPYSPPSTHDLLPPVVNQQPRDTWLNLLQLLHVGALMIAWVLTFVTIYSILYSGPVLAIYGTVLSIIAFRRAQTAIAWSALSTPGFAALIFALINLIPWGPTQAELPVRIMGGIYAFGTLALTVSIAAWRSHFKSPTVS